MAGTDAIREVLSLPFFDRLQTGGSFNRLHKRDPPAFS
jgi:hypothetical protein